MMSFSTIVVLDLHDKIGPTLAIPAMFAITFALQLIVAGAMRYGFELGDIESIGKGLLGGFGFGAFFIAPWIGAVMWDLNPHVPRDTGF